MLGLFTSPPCERYLAICGGTVKGGGSSDPQEKREPKIRLASTTKSQHRPSIIDGLRAPPPSRFTTAASTTARTSTQHECHTRQQCPTIASICRRHCCGRVCVCVCGPVSCPSRSLLKTSWKEDGLSLDPSLVFALLSLPASVPFRLCFLLPHREGSRALRPCP